MLDVLVSKFSQRRLLVVAALAAAALLAAAGGIDVPLFASVRIDPNG